MLAFVACLPKLKNGNGGGYVEGLGDFVTFLVVVVFRAVVVDGRDDVEVVKLCGKILIPNN